MESVKEKFVTTIKQWFPDADLETDPQIVDSLKVRLTVRVYVAELDKQRRTNPIIIHVSEHVISDLSNLKAEKLKRAFQA